MTGRGRGGGSGSVACMRVSEGGADRLELVAVEVVEQLLRERRGEPVQQLLAAAVASQHFLTRTGVT
jgi:hypothetical protein